MKEKAIITATITGSIHTPAMSPYLPITPKQIADEAVAAYEAGEASAAISSFPSAWPAGPSSPPVPSPYCWVATVGSAWRITFTWKKV